MVVASDKDACDQNSKPSTLSSFVSSTYHDYYHSILFTSLDLAFPWKQVVQH